MNENKNITSVLGKRLHSLSSLPPAKKIKYNTKNINIDADQEYYSYKLHIYNQDHSILQYKYKSYLKLRNNNKFVELYAKEDENNLILTNSPSRTNWNSKGSIEFKILKCDTTYCHCKISYEFPDPFDNKFEFTCKRTNGVILTFNNNKLQSITCKLKEDYNEFSKKFTIKQPIEEEIKLSIKNTLDEISNINFELPKPNICKINDNKGDNNNNNNKDNDIIILSPNENESFHVNNQINNNPIIISPDTPSNTKQSIIPNIKPNIKIPFVPRFRKGIQNSNSENTINIPKPLVNNKKTTSLSSINPNENKINKTVKLRQKKITIPSKATIVIDLDELEERENEDKKRKASMMKALESTKETQKVFTPYIPQRVPIHCDHPAKIVESTTLAGAELPPLKYNENLPDVCTKLLNNSSLSAVQLETVKFVGLRHLTKLGNNERAGYFIGDGTGVGKGRQIAAIIADNNRKGRTKAIWISASSALLQDSRRDMKDIGAPEIEIFSLPPIGQKLPEEGVLFLTYSLLVGKGSKKTKKSRYDQIIEWVSDGNTNYDFGGPLIFDEAHFAKNLQFAAGDVANSTTSRTAYLVNQIQVDLPLARVVYVSATGASDPKHMAYMRRLGLWGKGTYFEDFKSFKLSIGNSVAAMEMVAMEMKSLGMYCSRHLSFEGIKFDIDDLSLSQEHKEMYNAAAIWWQKVIHEYMKGYNHASYTGKSLNTLKLRSKFPTAILWSAHQRFFLQLCIAIKVSRCIKLTKDAIKDNMSVVIGLFTTGESSLEETLSKSINHEELLSAPQLLAETFLKKWFPAYEPKQTITFIDEFNNDKATGSETVELYPVPERITLLNNLIKELNEIKLPDNPLDELIHSLGGVEKVAEITGRSQRLINKPKSNTFTVDKRVPKKDNIVECANFMSGKKSIAIISEAASTGISLHSSNSCKNQKQRLHIILQLPWSAEKAVQQLGRTHRSYQKCPPYYKLLITELGGERRLASVVALRLGALGALTSGDRRATSACDALSEYVISNKYGCEALQKLSNSTTTIPTQSYNFPSIHDLDKITNNEVDIELIEALNQAQNLGAINASVKQDKVKRFLNRILGLTVEHQRLVFSDFIEQYDNAVLRAQMEGSFDDGIYDILGKVIAEKKIIYTHPSNPSQKTYLLEIETSSGTSWEEATNIFGKGQSAREKLESETIPKKKYLPNGFYEHKRSHHIILAIQYPDDNKKYHIVRPHLGHQSMPHYHNELKRKYKKISLSQARTRWIQKYDQERTNKEQSRKHIHGIISGSILPTCQLMREYFEKLSIVRALCSLNGKAERVVGILIPKDKISVLIARLREYEIAKYREFRYKCLDGKLEQHFLEREDTIKKLVIPEIIEYFNNPRSLITPTKAADIIRIYFFKESSLYEELVKRCSSNDMAITLWNQLTNFYAGRAYLYDYKAQGDAIRIINLFFSQIRVNQPQQPYNRVL